MNAKDNALRIIHFDNPEKVMGAPPSYTMSYYGANHEGFTGGGHNSPVGSRWVDIWGTEWHKIHEGVMGLPKGNPLSEIGNLKSYVWPDPDDDRICGQIYQIANSFPNGDHFLGGAHRDTLWEKAYMLVGMENMMAYFFTEPDFVKEVLHRIMDFQLGIAKHYLNFGIEYVMMGDDLGTQSGPLLGPRIVEEFLVPEYKRLFELYKEKGVFVNFHSCGRIDSMIETFMELGVDVLNPVQASANDLHKLRAMTNGKMALMGAVSSATIMDGPIERIAAEVRERLWQLGRNGGYFCCADQSMPFPKEHLHTVAKTVAEYGYYPIQNPAE